MGADCCKDRKLKTVDLKVHDSTPNTVTLRAAEGSSPTKDIHHVENDDADLTQDLLSNKASNHSDYLSIDSALEPIDTDDYKPPIECQTPPIIKALFGTNSEPNDIETPKTNVPTSHNAAACHQQSNGMSLHHNDRATPMGLGGDVYLGFENNDRPLCFQQQHRNSIHEANNIELDPPNNIIRNSSSTSSNSSCGSASGSSFTSDSDGEWTPLKSQNNNALLLGFAEQNDMVSFNGNEWDAMLANKESNAFTLSTMSLNSAHLADMVITGVGASSSFSSLKGFLATPNKHQMQWIIATFNAFIEYFPYKHIMQLIFGYCNIDINAFDFVFPSTAELDNKYNYYDTPHLFVENVSLSNKHQPCLVLMIGPPGSGKTSYASYRYGKQCVVAADDYFDIHHAGQFIGSQVKEAHRYCQEQVIERLRRKETVVVANTHSTYWQLYDKIIPVLFDATLPHKIVFAVMPETNSTTLVRRCVHSCTKPKIMDYVQSIRYMLREGGGICTDKVLKYGHKENVNDTPHWNTYKSDRFEYGLWIDSDGYRLVQDWYQHKTNMNLMCDVGDGRISPIIECTWPVFKKTFKKWIVLSKFTSDNDPVIDLEVRVIGYAKHRIAQMVALEIIHSSLSIHKHKKEKKAKKNTMEHAFWRMFKRQINTDSMGCVLAMRRGIPFNTAKYLFDYNCIQYVNDGPIVKAKLATKRYVRNYIKYYTPPPPIHNDAKPSSNNLFFNLEGVVSHHDVLSPDYKGAVIDKSSFSLKLREKHNSNQKLQTIEAKQNDENINTKNLNPHAKEFKMEEEKENKHEQLNPSAMEFKPKPQQPMQFMNLLSNPPLLAPNTQPWFAPPLQNNINFMLPQQPQLLQQNMACLPTQTIPPPPNMQNNNSWNVAMNGNAPEFKMMDDTPTTNGFKQPPQNTDAAAMLNPTANEFTSQQLPQVSQQYQHQTQPQQPQLAQLQAAHVSPVKLQNPFEAQEIDYSGMAAYADMQPAQPPQTQPPQPQAVAVPPFVPNGIQSNGIMNGNHNMNMNGNHGMNQQAFESFNNNNNTNMNIIYANNANNAVFNGV